MRRAIPHCHITCLEGEEMKAVLSHYLEALHSQNPSSIGGVLPDDGFYFR
jgi:NitT/TauT family transport system substrate-binding protein